LVFYYTFIANRQLIRKKYGAKKGLLEKAILKKAGEKGGQAEI
jgi:hypothetical protein